MGTETKLNCYTENTGGATGVLVNGVQKVANNNKLQQQQQLSQNSQQQDNSKQFNYYYTNGKQQQQQTAINGTSSVASKTSLILDQQEFNNCKTTNSSPLGSPTTTTVPFVPYYIDENNVIDGAKEILKVIRPYWDIEQVTFKKFTDGITNKLVGCFYNRSCSPTAEAATTSAASIFNKSKATTPPPPTSNGISQLSIHDDTNDSGNLSDATEDIDIATEERTDIDADDDGLDDGNEQEQQPAYATNNVVLVRVYGNKTDLLIDRKAETQNIILLHSYGMAPSLYATFKNGLAYDYVPGVTLNDELILRPEVWSLVASRMAEMHRRVVRPGEDAPSSQTIPMLWKKGQQFFDLVPERFTDPEKHKRLERTFLPISRIRAEFTELYNRLVALDSPIVFAHNDLLLGNVVYTESQQAVNFIDYEYADYNFQAFDIGNHFAEFAGVDSVDYSRYPPKAFQMAWLRVYLQSYLQRTDITELELERLYVQVNQFALAAHFFWTIWSIIQAEHSKIDFDYVEYAFMRYNEYLARKDEFLALQIPPRS